MKKLKEKPKSISEDNWDEDAGKPIRDVRTMGNKPPHRASHFFKTIYTNMSDVKHQKCIRDKLKKDPKWKYDENTHRWRYKPKGDTNAKGQTKKNLPKNG